VKHQPVPVQSAESNSDEEYSDAYDGWFPNSGPSATNTPMDRAHVATAPGNGPELSPAVHTGVGAAAAVGASGGGQLYG
jgi:hypothetical protein